MFNFKTLEIMNLENLNLVELNAQEVKEVDGGWIEMFWHFGFHYSLEELVNGGHSGPIYS